MRLKTARAISAFSHPVVVFPLTFPIFMAKASLSREQAYLLVLIAFFACLPFLYFFYQLKKKRIGDWDTIDRKERYPIYFMGIVGGSLAIALLAFFDHPYTFLIALAFYLLVVSVTVINFFWKISLHSATITAAVLLFNSFVQTNAYLFLLIPLVGWSRFEEKKHTPGQIFGGVVLGVVVVLGILRLGGKASLL